MLQLYSLNQFYFCLEVNGILTLDYKFISNNIKDFLLVDQNLTMKQLLYSCLYKYLILGIKKNCASLQLTFVQFLLFSHIFLDTFFEFSESVPITFPFFLLSTSFIFSNNISFCTL